MRIVQQNSNLKGEGTFKSVRRERKQRGAPPDDGDGQNAPPKLCFILVVERSVRDAIVKVLISASHCLLHVARVD